MFAPSIADALELRRAGGGPLDTRHPIDLVLIPMANMGDGHKESYDRIVASLLAAEAAVVDDAARGGGEPPCAYYVERRRISGPIARLLPVGPRCSISRDEGPVFSRPLSRIRGLQGRKKTSNARNARL